MLYVCNSGVAEDNNITPMAYVFVDTEAHAIHLYSIWWPACIIELDELDACAMLLAGAKLFTVDYIISSNDANVHGLIDSYKMHKEAIMISGEVYEVRTWLTF
jgi:hypothetical protein